MDGDRKERAPKNTQEDFKVRSFVENKMEMSLQPVSPRVNFLL